MTSLYRFRKNRNVNRNDVIIEGSVLGQGCLVNIIKDSDNFLENSKWTGTTSITLERNSAGHREGYTLIAEYLDSLQPQIMTQQTCCIKFIWSFYCNGPNILSGLAEVENDLPVMGDAL